MTKTEVKERIYKGECLSDMFEFTDGQDCEIYKGDWNSGEDVIYIPDIDLNEICINRPLIQILDEEEIEDILSSLYTGRDFMELVDDNEELAKRLFYYVDWQHPISAFNEIMCDEEGEEPHYGEIKVSGDCFIIKEKEENTHEEWKYLCKAFGFDPDLTERIVFDGVVKYFGVTK